MTDSFSDRIGLWEDDFAAQQRTILLAFELAPRGADITSKPSRSRLGIRIFKDITLQHLLKLPLIRRSEGGKIDRLAPIKSFAEFAHSLRHREIANPHFAKIGVEVAAKRVEEPLPVPAPAIVAAEPVDQQHQMKDNQIETALYRVRNAVAAVKGRQARLRHDRAIEVADAAILGIGSKEPPNHKVNRGRHDQLDGGRLPILSFGGTARGAWTQLGTRMWGNFVRSPSGPVAAACAIVVALALSGCGGETFQRGYVLPDGALEQIPLGASQEQVLLVLGTPSTVATVSGEAFYYISQKADRPVAFMRTKVTDQRVIAVYFDKDRKVRRVAEYGLKDGHIFDFVSQTTPTGGNDLSVVTTIIHNLEGRGT